MIRGLKTEDTPDQRFRVKSLNSCLCDSCDESGHTTEDLLLSCAGIPGWQSGKSTGLVFRREHPGKGRQKSHPIRNGAHCFEILDWHQKRKRRRVREGKNEVRR